MCVFLSPAEQLEPPKTENVQHRHSADQRQTEETGETQGGFHRICSFIWAENYWILLQSKEEPEVDDEIGG